MSIFYSQCLAYLNEWTVHFEEMQNFNWILLQELIRWTVVKETHTFILERRPNLHIDDNALFDEITLLKNIVTMKKINEWNDSEIGVDCRWVEIFDHFKSKSLSYKNISQIVEFFLSLPGSNAPTERIFSLMNNYWQKQKSNLNISTLKAAPFTTFNYEMNCWQFSDYLSSKNQLLQKIHSSERYNFGLN